MKKDMSIGGREGEGRSRGERHRAIAVWERALEEERLEREQERQRWLSRAKQKLAGFFRGKQVDKVYLFGSLLHEEYFYPFSDIDLAVAGLREDYFALLVELEELLDRRVDVVELEKCRFRDQIERQGVRIK